MFGLTVSEAAAICGGSVSDMKCDAEITSVAIDSRAVIPAVFSWPIGESGRTDIALSPRLWKRGLSVPLLSTCRRE